MLFLTFVFISSIALTALIVCLVALLSLVEAKVMHKGDCKIDVNDGKKILTVSSGKNLLSSLVDKKIFLPSGCGGGGTCGICKCQVLKGGGDVLPTETGFLSRREQKEHVRLACQVKVRNNIDIRIPDEIFDVKKFECKVLSNNNVATFIKELVLELPKNIALDFKAGGYIQLDVPEYKLSYDEFEIEKEYRVDWDKNSLWKLKAMNDELTFRAYSMANHPQESGKVILNVRIATPPAKVKSAIPGIASSYIFNLKPKDKIMVSGPYGEFFIKDSNREMIYIGGGAGMAPMRSHLFHLFHTLETKRKVSFWYGARSKREMFYDDEFREIAEKFPNFNYQVSLSEPDKEDYWDGLTGFIHQSIYDNYLKHHEDPEEVEYYLCGPPMMIDAVIDMLDSLGVPPEMIAYDKF